MSAPVLSTATQQQQQEREHGKMQWEKPKEMQSVHSNSNHHNHGMRLMQQQRQQEDMDDNMNNKNDPNAVGYSSPRGGGGGGVSLVSCRKAAMSKGDCRRPRFGVLALQQQQQQQQHVFSRTTIPLLLFFFFFLGTTTVTAFSSTTITTTSTSTTAASKHQFIFFPKQKRTKTQTKTTIPAQSTRLSAAATTTTNEQWIVMDGPEWKTLQNALLQSQSTPAAAAAAAAALGGSGGKQSTTTLFTPPTRYGCFQLVTGKFQGNPVIAMKAVTATATTTETDTKEGTKNKSGGSMAIVQLDGQPTVSVYESSIAKIPARAALSNDVTAVMTTYRYCLSLISPVYTPVLSGVGGSSDDFVVLDSDSSSSSTGSATTENGNAKTPQRSTPSTKTSTNERVVVLGGNALAVSVATALQCPVTVVSTGNRPAGLPVDSDIQHLNPSVGGKTLELPFCAVVDQFTAMIDTLGDESPKVRYTGELRKDPFDPNSDDDNNDNEMILSSGVLRLLQQRHGCTTYVSSLTRAQTIVQREGMLWGPGKADRYVADVTEKLVPVATKSNNKSNNKDVTYVLPPPYIGKTVEAVLAAGVTSWPQAAAAKSRTAAGAWVRGWNMKDVWEYTTWPRDSTGGANVRYGLPVVEDLLDSSMESIRGGLESEATIRRDDMISAPPLRSGRFYNPDGTLRDDDNDDGNEQGEDAEPVPAAGEANPYVLQVVGVKGLQEEIVEPRLDCILFLSAPFCRTCRYLKPQYQRMARLGTETDNNFVYAKADAVGKVGKELGRALHVDAVPTFVFFRQGQRWGKPMGASRLPSKKLDLAIRYLQQGKEWDDDLFRDTAAGASESDNKNNSKASNKRSKI